MFRSVDREALALRLRFDPSRRFHGPVCIAIVRWPVQHVPRRRPRGRAALGRPNSVRSETSNTDRQRPNIYLQRDVQMRSPCKPEP